MKSVPLKRTRKAENKPSEKPQNEDVLLRRIRRALQTTHSAAPQLPLNIGDDAALFKPSPGYETVLTCDWFLQGTHFLLDRHPPYAVGWKCLARAASDLAAMGAEPRCFLLSLALPLAKTSDWLDEFLRGLRTASRKLQCPAAGGDTTRQDEVLINITVVGECKRGRAVLRSGARPGDAIFVSGRLGEAEYGLRLMQKHDDSIDPKDFRLTKHLYPQPRLRVASWLANRQLVTAMMDLSDGLSSDLPRLCTASNVGARIAEASVPCVRLAEPDAKKFDPLFLALHGGDDYELLFTVAPKHAASIPRKIAGVNLTRIGEITAQRNVVVLIDRANHRLSLPARGWNPFRSNP
jgi:thiamine-monophosphate kinase